VSELNTRVKRQKEEEQKKENAPRPKVERTNLTTGAERMPNTKGENFTNGE